MAALQDDEGKDTRSLLRWLAGLKDDHPAWVPLISAATTGETHFFREQEQFRSVARHLLPRIAERGGPVRIWSAATSNGAEAWSLAFTLADFRTGRPLPGDFVLGTDIDHRRLEHARQGIYGSWAFREVDAADLPGRFRRKPEGGYLVRRPPGLVVRFAYHNLLNRRLPLAAEGERFSLIFCRNALLYFGQEHLGGVIDGLAGCLEPGGMLLVAPCETHLLRRRLASETIGGITVFFNEPFSARIKRNLPPAPRTATPSPKLPKSRPPEPKATLFRDKERPSIPISVSDELSARARREQESREDAAKTEPEPNDPLREAVDAFASGDGRKALDLLRRLLYEDPENLPALVLRATHATSESVRRRSVRQALEALDSRSPDERVPELDDAPVSEIREFLEDLLQDDAEVGPL